MSRQTKTFTSANVGALADEEASGGTWQEFSIAFDASGIRTRVHGEAIKDTDNQGDERQSKRRMSAQVKLRRSQGSNNNDQQGVARTMASATVGGPLSRGIINVSKSVPQPGKA